MSTYSLKKQLLVSHHKVNILATLSLVFAVFIAIALYFNTQSLIKSDLPDAIEINELKYSVSQSNFFLNAWLLSGNQSAKAMKKEVWLNSIEPIMAKIEKYKDRYYTNEKNVSILSDVKRNVDQLKLNQQYLEQCLNCFLNKENEEFKFLHEENIFISQNIDAFLNEFVKKRNEKIEGVLSIIAHCLILFCVISIFCIILFNVYTVLVANKTAENYLSRIRKIIGATTFLCEKDPEFLTPEGNDEIAQLMREFNVMQETICSREAELRLQRDDINQLTRVVTHDMKPPIINIKGHAKIIAENGDELLKDNNNDSFDNLNTVKKSIVYIEQSVLRLDELVAGILTYSKLSDKEIILEKVPILNVIKEVLDINQHRLTTAKVEVFKCFPEILFDRFVIKFIVSTIIDNAIAYQHENRPLTLAIDYCKDKGNHEISIKDNGIGVQQHQIDNLFTPSNKTSLLGGAGIGLATAQTLIRRFNGDIVYRKNDTSIGSLFVILLPL